MGKAQLPAATSVAGMGQLRVLGPTEQEARRCVRFVAGLPPYERLRHSPNAQGRQVLESAPRVNRSGKDRRKKVGGIDAAPPDLAALDNPRPATRASVRNNILDALDEIGRLKAEARDMREMLVNLAKEFEGLGMPHHAQKVYTIAAFRKAAQ